MSARDIVVPAKADETKDLECCWQANSEAEAARMVRWLKDLGLRARVATLSDLKDWELIR